MDIKPIRNDADHQFALMEIDSHLDAAPGTPAGDYLEVMITLVEAYEAAHFPIPEPDDTAEVLEYYLESRGLGRADLIPFLGSKERVSEILNRKRGLSLSMIRRLHTGLGIPADILLGKTVKALAQEHAARSEHRSPAGTAAG